MAMAVSNQQSRDAALLRATTDLFVLEAKHDPDELRRFEELAIHFLAKVTPADRAFVAERLASHDNVPAAVLRLLAKDLVEIATPILKRSHALSEFDWLAIMAATGPAHHRAIAGRADLSPALIGALRLTGDPETTKLLAHYPATEVRRIGDDEAAKPIEPAETIEILVETPAVEAASEPVAEAEPAADRELAAALRPMPSAPRMIPEAREVYATARAMTAALDAELRSLATGKPIAPAKAPAASATAAKPAPIEAAKPEEPVAHIAEDKPADGNSAATPTRSETLSIEAFLALDRPARLAALLRLSGSHGTPSRRATAIDADLAFMKALSGARASLVARQKQRGQLIDALSAGLRLERDEVAALMDDRSGEALVVLLKAIGLGDEEAVQVLMFANPLLSQAVETFGHLAELHAGLDRGAASRLVETWRGEGERPQRHEPVFADMELRGRAHQDARRPAQSEADRVGSGKSA